MSKNRKILLSVDIEGISGVMTPEFSNLDGTCYAQARKLMGLNTNSVIQGILKADHSAEIVVRDAHCGATNLIFEDLHPAANLIQGWGNSINMIQGIDASYDGVFLIGYHAGGQNRQGALSHTLTRRINWIKINGQLVNEAGWAAVLAGHYNVPVAFLSGDSEAVVEAKEQFKNIETVAVKHSMGRDCALSYPLSVVSKELEEVAYKATQNLIEKTVPPLKFKTPLEVEIKLFDTGYDKSPFQFLFELLSFDDNYHFNHNECSVAFQAKTQLEAYHRFVVLFFLFKSC